MSLPGLSTLLFICGVAVCLIPVDGFTQNNSVVTFTFSSYTPSSVNISVGDSVTWTGAFNFHPLEQVTGVLSDTPTAGGFAYSGSNTSFTQVFNTAGTFYYRCTSHGVAALGGTMRGSVTVSAANPFPPRNLRVD